MKLMCLSNYMGNHELYNVNYINLFPSIETHWYSTSTLIYIEEQRYT